MNHPANTAWNPTAHGALIEPFMPVPGSAVGVAISSYAPAQADTAAFPGTFTVRLSTFSSKPVAVNWAVIGKPASGDGSEVALASGLLEFAPGEVSKAIAPVVATPGSYAVIRVALSQPVNAEVTGEAWYFKAPDSGNPTLIARGSTAWRYRETRSEPPADWKALGFDDSSPAATEWLPCTLPAGFVGSTAFSPAVTFGTTVSYGTSSDRTKTYYFRRRFTVADPTQLTSLTFNIRRDDAAAMWLNNEVTATVVSADGTFNPPFTYTTSTPNATSTGTYHSFQIPASKLVAGVNILAVEVHQTSVTSSDLLLDCELLATWRTPLQLHLTSAGGQHVLYWLDDGAVLEHSPDLQLWQPVPGGLSPLPIYPNGVAEFFRLRK